MTITIADLQRLAEENPVGFMTAVKTALETTKKQAPEVAQKFVWGETGVEQHSAAEILAALGSMQGGQMIVSMIASAVSGIDVSTVAERDNVQVASTMRSGIVAHVRWRTGDESDYGIAGQTLQGDCFITIDINSLSPANIVKVKEVIADSRRVKIYRTTKRGVPTRDRIRFVCMEVGKE